VNGNPAKARSNGIPLASARRLPPSNSDGQKRQSRKRHWSPTPTDSTDGGTPPGNGLLNAASAHGWMAVRKPAENVIHHLSLDYFGS